MKCASSHSINTYRLFTLYGAVSWTLGLPSKEAGTMQRETSLNPAVMRLWDEGCRTVVTDEHQMSSAAGKGVNIRVQLCPSVQMS